nr:MAG TPA: hypothetical protein [Caudoviricetes sp.]
MIKYDLYKRPNGFRYRVPLYSTLNGRAEFWSNNLKRWSRSNHKIGRLVSSEHSTLVARNVVFKDGVCSQ